MYILGISAYFHDSAACLIKSGKIIAAAQEERFSRIKHDSNFPVESIKFCLNYEGIDAKLIDYVVFYEKPFVKFERLIETYFAFAPKGLKSFIKAIPIWVKEKIFLKNFISKNLKSNISKIVNWQDKILFSEHHLSHAASAYYPSPFAEAAILTIDGVGEWTTTSLSVGEGNNIEILSEINFPHSLGLLYSAFTYFLGFKVNSGEYKVMGLAPYGEPKYVDLIRHMVDIKEDGSFFLDMSYFNYCTGLTMTSKKFHDLFGSEPRKPESDLVQKHMDIASSLQQITDEIIIKLSKYAALKTNKKNLCLAGGVALNCVANGNLEKQKIFENIWIQPAAGDAGGSIGCALAAWYSLSGSQKQTSSHDYMQGSFLGPSYNDNEIEIELNKYGVRYTKYGDDELIDKVANYLSQKKAIGWMQGRMEFGPRALGSRSILADPRDINAQRNLNLKIKFRESFRPFAPSVLEEYCSDWFNLKSKSPYMLIVSDVKNNKRLKNLDSYNNLFGIDKLNVPKSIIPAVTHVDFSSRIQTVNKYQNSKYHRLISKFYELTGCPILVNTSFNIRGEPIVCKPYDAIRCFMGTDLDVLAIGNFILEKNEQSADLVKSYVSNYDLD